MLANKTKHIVLTKTSKRQEPTVRAVVAGQQRRRRGRLGQRDDETPKMLRMPSSAATTGSAWQTSLCAVRPSFKNRGRVIGITDDRAAGLDDHDGTTSSSSAPS